MIIAMSRMTWDGLAPADREVVKKTAVEVAAWQKAEARKGLDGAQDAVETLRKNGMEVVVLSPAEAAVLREKTRPVADIFLPIFLPIVAHFGWDPVWFGVMMTVNVAIGQVTPPVAVNLYVAANVAHLRMETVAGAVWPFVGAMLLALGLVMLWPGLSLWLPHAFGLR